MNILIIILAIIGIFLVAAIFIKREYSIVNELLINKPLPEVFNYVKFLKNQDHYNKWVMADPSARKTYIGTDGTAGFIYQWESENKSAGKGEQEIKSIIDGKEINYEIRFEKPFKNTANTFILTQAVSEKSTKLSWGMKGKNKYPYNIMNLFIPNLLRKDLQVSLNTLKKNLEI